MQAIGYLSSSDTSRWCGSIAFRARPSQEHPSRTPLAKANGLWALLSTLLLATSKLMLPQAVALWQR